MTWSEFGMIALAWLMLIITLLVGAAVIANVYKERAKTLKQEEETFNNIADKTTYLERLKRYEAGEHD